MEEINELYDKRTKKQSQIDQYKGKIQTVEDKIERLEQKKTSIQEIKEGIGERIDPIVAYIEDVSPWEGVRYTKCSNYVHEDLVSAYQSYKTDVDGVLDTICDEITRLKKESSELQGFLGTLQNTIWELSNEIEKLLN